MPEPEKVYVVKLVTGEEVFGHNPEMKDHVLQLEQPLVMEYQDLNEGSSRAMFLNRYCPFGDSTKSNFMATAIVSLAEVTGNMRIYYLRSLEWCDTVSAESFERAIDQANDYIQERLDQARSENVRTSTKVDIQSAATEAALDPLKTSAGGDSDKLRERLILSSLAVITDSKN